MTDLKISKVFTAEPPEMSKEEKARFTQIKNARTTPRDERFTSTNQALHCWNRYNEWVLCTKQTDDEDTCKPLRYSADSVCPGIWTELWDEQRDTGAFGGIGSRFDEKHH